MTKVDWRQPLLAEERTLARDIERRRESSLPKRLFQLVSTIFVMAGLFFAWQRFMGPVALNGSRQPQHAATAPPVAVTAAAARLADFPVYLNGLGQVQAFNTVTIHSRVDGQIEQIYFKEGQMVKQGDLLMQIDAAPFQAALEQAKAKLAQDQANLQNAKLDLQRYSNLAKQSFATQQQLDTQQALVHSDNALIQADQATVDAAQVQLDYTQIRAPISGRIGFRLVDVGNIVHTTDTNGILTISQLQPISVVFTAPGDQVDQINKVMQTGPVQVAALSDDGSRTLDTGTLTVVNNQVDPATETVQLKATFENANNALWPGVAVQTKTLIDTLDNVLVIPAGAVEHGQNGLYAFVVTNADKVEMRPIKVSKTGDGLAVVAEGLAAGDRVVTSGSYRLQNGTAVTISQTPASASAQEQTP